MRSRLLGSSVVALAAIGVGFFVGERAAFAQGSQISGITARAKELVRRGLSAHDAGRFDEAIALFEEAYELAPHPAILFNLAQSYRLQGQKEKALGYYRKYLAALAKGGLSDVAKEWMARLSAEQRDEEARRAEEEHHKALQLVEREQARQWDQRISRGTLEDANATTGFLMPTALLPAQGTLSVHDYDVLLAGVSYSPRRWLLLSATLAPTYLTKGLIGSVAAKLQLLRGERLRLAMHGAVFAETAGIEASAAGLLGAVATICLELSCRSHFDVYGAGGKVEGALARVLSAGATLHVAGPVKLMAEASGVVLDESLRGEDEGTVIWYGARLAWPRVSFDLGFVVPNVGERAGVVEETPMGIPSASVTYRAR